MNHVTNLEARRRRAGLTQYALAAVVGSDRAHYCQVEGGKRRPSPALLGRLADAIGGDPATLLAPVCLNEERPAGEPGEALNRTSLNHRAGRNDV